MTVFVDASAMIAIIAGEDGADALADALDGDRDRLCSALSIWKMVAGLCRPLALSMPKAREHAGRFLEVGGFRFVAIGVPEWEIATEAYARYGKGRHPAALNIGDCFAYACARANGARLLYKGEDFTRTDLA
ncbi:type II toxin-antitoxin system VapC family toxin [Roseomonas sp. BN140053]|uniref:type II toxin-antitoxin system VapC family toxin n=1 Tax=Roseomonas sp. BN140053 TaxID=3391898 RepID=UPI0039EB99DE